MIVLIDNTTTATGLNGASYLNPLARDPKDADCASVFIEVRQSTAVQEAAAALVSRVADLYAQHGISRAIAAAVQRVQASGHHPTLDLVLQAVEDMAGEVSILAENVGHAARLEARLAAEFERERQSAIGIVGLRLGEIQRALCGVEREAAQDLADEAEALHEWLDEPWRHPRDLVSTGGYFAALFGESDEGGASTATTEAAPAA
ncbi:hypothetical protein [Xenophilus azovorans]|uniref:hypothetical protein n=1 Tax=Xenophilus azovorans TaxID=151755 RepID=UPI00056FA7A4|nr:hypothetical protein [Xenophilus azovorans]